MRMMLAAYALCAGLLMAIGVFGSTPADAGYYRSSNHWSGHHGGHGYYGGHRLYRGGHHRGWRGGYGVVRTGHYGGRGYYGGRHHFGHRHHGHRLGHYGGYWPRYGYGVRYLHPGYYGDLVGYRYRGYRFHPGYIRGYGCGGGCGGYGYGGCGGGFIRYAWSGFRASHC